MLFKTEKWGKYEDALEKYEYALKLLYSKI